jgi:malic enzyme
VANPHEAGTLTARANLVGVITNGTAVLGLGNIGPLAAKPVMEGKGVLFKKFAPARKLSEVIEGADVFLGLSAGGVMKPEMVAKMASRPLIMALANPTPEILPEEVKKVRDDALMATGRSDYPNQVNNVLCFPFIFRGALDVGATTITDQMKLAAVKAIAELARAEASDIVAAAYGEKVSGFGPGVHHPQALRSAPDRQDRPGSGPRGHGVRCGDAADHRFRSLPPAAQQLRVAVRPGHEAGLPGRQAGTQAHHLLRGRGRARAACRADGGG